MEFHWYELWIPLVAGAIGYIVRLFYDRRKELQGEVNIKRREVYKEFIDIIVDEIELEGKLDEESLSKLNKKMFTFFRKYMLYASPDVINAFGNYRQYAFKHMFYGEAFDEEIHTKNLAKVIYEMRDDLGLSNKQLGADGEYAFRGLLVRYDEIFKS